MSLLQDWPFVALLAATPLLIELCKPSNHPLSVDTKRQSRWSSLLKDQTWWMRAALPMYLLHEFEEHGYDFLGRRYAFQPYFCKNLVGSPTFTLHMSANLTLFFFFLN